MKTNTIIFQNLRPLERSTSGQKNLCEYLELQGAKYLLKLDFQVWHGDGKNVQTFGPMFENTHWRKDSERHADGGENIVRVRNCHNMELPQKGHLGLHQVVPETDVDDHGHDYMETSVVLYYRL